MAKKATHFVTAVFGIIFAIVYINFAISHLNDEFYLMYVIYGGICVFQALFNTSSGFLAIKNVKTKVYTILLILSVITSIPLVPVVFFWLAHFCGIDFLPPPQS